jgi:hypothetical protein
MNMRKELELENNGNENDGEKTKHLEKKKDVKKIKRCEM